MRLEDVLYHMNKSTKVHLNVYDDNGNKLEEFEGPAFRLYQVVVNQGHYLLDSNLKVFYSKIKPAGDLVLYAE